MNTKTITTEADIRAAVVGQGFADCAIVRQYVKPRPETFDIDQGGTWFVLFVDGQLWGRRRTLGELLDMAKRGPIF